MICRKYKDTGSNGKDKPGTSPKNNIKLVENSHFRFCLTVVNVYFAGN